MTSSARDGGASDSLVSRFPRPRQDQRTRTCPGSMESRSSSKMVHRKDLPLLNDNTFTSCRPTENCEKQGTVNAPHHKPHQTGFNGSSAPPVCCHMTPPAPQSPISPPHTRVTLTPVNRHASPRPSPCTGVQIRVLEDKRTFPLQRTTAGASRELSSCPTAWTIDGG